MVPRTSIVHLAVREQIKEENIEMHCSREQQKKTKSINVAFTSIICVTLSCFGLRESADRACFFLFFSTDILTVTFELSSQISLMNSKHLSLHKFEVEGLLVSMNIS